MEIEQHISETYLDVSSQEISLPSPSNYEVNSLDGSTFIKLDPNEMKLEQHLNETDLFVSSQQIFLPSTVRHDANSLSDSTCITPELDDVEYNANKTSQGVSSQQIPLKCEVKEEIMYCQLCPYSDVDIRRLKFHTFTQHPTGAEIITFGESDDDIKFFCVKETCNFSTTVCTVYEEHLRNCCPLNQTLSGKERERLKSTLQFVLDFHNKHCLSDVTGLLEYFSSFNKTYTSEDNHFPLRKHMKHYDVFSDLSRSDIQSSMVFDDVVERKLDGPLSTVSNPVPVFIVQNQNINIIESETSISEDISMSIRKQNKINEPLIKTCPSKLKISKSQVHSHMEMQTGKTPFSCVNCDKLFQYHSDFLIHMKIHSGEKPCKYKVCDKTSSRPQHLIAHKTIDRGKKPFKCHECNKSFRTSSNFQRHKRIHSGEKPFLCDVCHHGFTDASYLVLHKRSHSGERPFKCNFCDKKFTRSNHLADHKRMHTGEKPFKCDVCDKEYTSSSGLYYHKRTHNGEKPFKCDVCDRDYTSSTGLFYHKRTHTGEKPFKCDVCDKDYNSSTGLFYHKRTHTGGKPFK